MAKHPRSYTEQDLDGIMSPFYPSIFVMRDGKVHVGFLRKSCLSNCYTVVPPTTNRGGTVIGRNSISRIVLFNGAIYPKGFRMDGNASRPHRLRRLDMLEMSELIGKAGYEFI